MLAAALPADSSLEPREVLLVSNGVKTMSSLTTDDMALSEIVVQWECHEFMGWANPAGMSRMFNRHQH